MWPRPEIDKWGQLYTNSIIPGSPCLLSPNLLQRTCPLLFRFSFSWLVWLLEDTPGGAQCSRVIPKSSPVNLQCQSRTQVSHISNSLTYLYSHSLLHFQKWPLLDSKIFFIHSLNFRKNFPATKIEGQARSKNSWNVNVYKGDVYNVLGGFQSPALGARDQYQWPRCNWVPSAGRIGLPAGWQRSDLSCFGQISWRLVFPIYI